MLRQVCLVALLVFLLSALVLLDFKSAERLAVSEDQDPPGFAGHVLERVTRLAGLIGFGHKEMDVSGQLARMLPTAPSGWERREVAEGDAKALLARNQKDNDAGSVALIQDLLTPDGPKGTRVAHQAFARKDWLVVFKLVRHPDALFTEAENLAALDALWSSEPGVETQGYLRLRGFDIAELTLPEKIRSRVFTAEVGGQLRLWVLASGRLEDADLLPFFETLDVTAMNAAVLDGEAALGDVPVMLLVSDLKGDAHAAYETDRTERARDKASRRAERRAALTTGPGVEARPDAEACSKDPSGFTICASDG